MATKYYGRIHGVSIFVDDNLVEYKYIPIWDIPIIRNIFKRKIVVPKKNYLF